MQWGTALEQRIDAIADRMLQDAAARGARAAAIEFIVFVLKQAWACIFGRDAGVRAGDRARAAGDRAVPHHGDGDGTVQDGCRVSRYPRRWLTAIVAAAIYVNFFTHHFWWDARWVLFGTVVVLWGGTVMHARIRVRIVRLPLLLVFAGVALFLWVAENIGTWAGAWVYPDQVAGWQPVSLSKMGSWFLLMIISVVLVAWVYPPRAPMASSPEPIEAPPAQQERPR